ncbi:MAG TPA: PIG-L family deacetylase [Kiloniellaceae bacterium]|nr:PIG-L family deacetylase [Kiloniellaceae bacterium]
MRAEKMALVLLAHQDDELVFSPLIARLVASGKAVRVVYLTNGVPDRSSPDGRNSESTRALAKLGVPASHIRFLGTELSVCDGQLLHRFTSTYRALLEDCRSAGPFGDLFTLAWEGGHPDHDAAHVVAVKLARTWDADDRAWQLPFYRAANLGPPWFSLFAPLSCNGAVQDLPSARQDALLRAKMIRFYPSQWRTFIVLGPVIFWHAVLATPVKLQRLQIHRALERPTLRPLLYERRNGVSFAEFAERANRFLEES